VYPVEGERSIDIAAPPERVWALVTDIGRMGEWSPHTVVAQWVDVAGIAVHVAARLLSLAEPGELLVSATVPDLVAGSGLQFLDRGLHELKGMEGKRQVFAVVG
jgi:hypothetical protein